jgi:hypothetical protein
MPAAMTEPRPADRWRTHHRTEDDTERYPWFKPKSLAV